MYDYCILIYWRKMIQFCNYCIITMFLIYVTFTRSFSFFVIVYAAFGGWTLWFTPTRSSHPFKSTRASMFQHPASDVWFCPSLWNSAGSRRSVRSSGWKTAHLFIVTPFEPACHSCFSVSSTRTLDKWFLKYWEETLLPSPVSFSLAEDLENVQLYLMLKKVHQVWGFVHLKAFNSGV